jgi:hypothetical protein
MCPQGLFFVAFAEDAEKLGMYVYNKQVRSLSDKGIEYVFESFDVCFKKDENTIIVLQSFIHFMNLMGIAKAKEEA